MSASNKDDTHEMIDAKIHVMQHDLDEIAKSGHVEIESTQKKTSETKEPAIKTQSANISVPSDSPFSQSEYVLEPSEPARAHTVEESEPQAPKEEPHQETPSPNESGDIAIPSASSSTPLNLPSFHAAPTPTSPTPRGPMRLNIGQQTSLEIPSTNVPESAPEPNEALKLPVTSQESLRTGTWPVTTPTQTTHAKKTVPKKAQKKISLRKAPTDKKLMSDNIILKERWGWKHYLMMLVVIGSIGGGAFYFWKTRLSSEGLNLPTVNLPNIPDISSNKSADDLREQSDDSLPFSTTNANPFIVDVETETVSTLRERLIQDADDMQKASMTGPVPFSIVDKTNTPIAFFIFASIFNLGLSGNLLNSLDNNFTLFIFLDNNEPRIVLSIATKDVNATRKYLAESERTLPLSLKNILLVDTPPTIPAAIFSTTAYKGATIQYFNLSSETPLSFDYAISENTLVLGTSKNSERAVLDTIIDSKR